MLLLKSVFDSLPENDKEIERVFPLEYLKGITALFSSDTIYCYADPENRIEYKEKLADNIKKAFPSVVDHKALSVKQIEKSLGTAKTTVSLGICKGKTSDALPGYFLTKDQRIDYQGSTYLVENGIAYETQKILWRPVYCDDEYFVLLSQNIVDIRNGGDDLKKWLTDVFFKLSFEDDEKEAIKTVKLLSEEDISKSQTDDILSFSDSDTHWWLDARNSGALQKVVKKDGTVYQSGYNFRTKNRESVPLFALRKTTLHP